MKIAVVFGTSGVDVRTAKTCRSLARMGHEVHFVGWNRRPEVDLQPELGQAQSHVLSYGTSRGRSTTWGQARFSWHVTRTLRRLRPDAVCAVNEDNVLRVLPAKGYHFRHLVCDLYDSHQDRFSRTAGWRGRVLRAACSKALRSAERLIVTDPFRLQRLPPPLREKSVVVYNVPEDPGPESAARRPAGPVSVFVSGALSRSRGLPQILAAVERLPSVSVVAAGWVGDAYAEQHFIKHPQVDYRGTVTPSESLELAAGCDAILAFYEPSNQNNLMASPNKVFDAMSIGRPVIINAETTISGWIDQMGLAAVCGYHDTGALVQIIAGLESARSQLPQFAHRARQIFLQQFSWSHMEQRLHDLYCRLESTTIPPAARAA